jgi:chemotaxis protein CheC
VAPSAALSGTEDAPELSELHLDALAETFNLALGEAAAVFSRLISEEIELSVPAVELVHRDQVAERLGGMYESTASSRLCSITQRFSSSGAFQTETMLIFPEQGSLEIVRLMLGDEATVERISELEQDALAEVGNIIINGCMSSLANLFKKEVLGTLPQVQVSDARSLVAAYCRTERVLLARIGMHLSVQDVRGYVLFMMDTTSIRSFLGDVEAVFQL